MVRTVVDNVRDWSDGAGSSRVLVFGDKAPSAFAAFANGVIARAVDLGDTHSHGGHIGEWNVPVLLSGLNMADHPISGKELITAWVAGAEWGVREQVTTHLQYHTKTMPGELAGSRFAAVSLAKMLGLTKEQIWAAVGMVFSCHSQSEQQKYNEGAENVRLQHGFAGTTSVEAVSLARSGVTAIKGVYMGQGGLLKNIKHGDLESPGLLTEDLGKRWIWREELTMKPYAGCKYNHAPSYGLLSMMKEHGFGWQDIENAHFTVSAGARCTIEPAGEKWHPVKPSQALFSNPYNTAYTVITGDCFLEAHTPDVIAARMASPEFQELMPRLTYEVDESLPPFDYFPIKVTLKDGRVFSKVESSVPGNVNDPMSWEQLESKFWNCTRFSAVDLGKEKYQTIIDLCRRLEELDDVRVLLDAMMP